jgi:hypothetical protein
MPRGRPNHLTEESEAKVTMATLHVLLVHPVWFSKRVKASLVDTLVPCLPESTSRVAIAAMVVPTEESTRIKSSLQTMFLLAVNKSVEEVDPS